MRRQRMVGNGSALPSTRGERSPTAKLKEADAQAILDAQEIELATVLSERYGVSVACVQDVWRRRSWKHLKRSRPLPSMMESEL